MCDVINILLTRSEELCLEASIKCHNTTLLPLAMVLPLLIVGGLGVGGATGYGMYQLGSSLALPARLKQSPPPKGFGALSAGAFSAGAAYSLQWRVLNRHLAHLLTYEVPQNVAKWRARDFLRLAVPIVAPHAVMFSSSLAVMGFVTTKVAVGGSKQ